MRQLRSGVLALVASALFVSSLVIGQDFPRAEVFGGYSYLHVDTQGTTSTSLTNECNVISGGSCPLTFQVHPGLNGWDEAVQGNLSRWFGLKAEFAGHYGNLITAKFVFLPPLGNFSAPNQHIYDFMFGPVLSHRAHNYTAFVHGLIGGENVGFGRLQISGIAPINLPGPASRTYFAFALGGGFDIRASKHFAIRVGQLDYQFVKNPGSGSNHQNDLQVAVGIVYGFGGK